jgi:glucan 1,3-beta-glucosidase
MGVANAQRSLDYIRIITEFISQPEYLPVVPFFGEHIISYTSTCFTRANAVVSGIVNEPRIMEGTHVLDPQAVQNFYYEAYNIMRNVTGIGEGKGPMIVRPRPF